MPAGSDWLQALPKLELHAHLSGSIHEQTILRFLKEEQEYTAALQDADLLQAINSEIRDFKLGASIPSHIFPSSRPSSILSPVLCPSHH